MKYLLDTHVLLWYYENSSQLHGKIQALIDDRESEIYISIASLWEISIKLGLGKLSLKISFDDLMKIISDRDFKILQVEIEYLKHLSKLPLIHKDPFDRLLVATAQAEDLTLITADENIHKYDITINWS